MGDVLDNGTETAQRNDASHTTEAVHVWTVQDGKATRFRAYDDDQYAQDEFWSRAPAGAPLAGDVGHPSTSG